MPAMLPSDHILVDSILTGHLPASSAIGKDYLYDALNKGASGPLPFLGTSTKIDAGKSAGILTRVLYMMPAKASGREACAGRSNGCTASCLAEYTGRMSMSAARTARRRRHAAFFADRSRFLADIAREIAHLEREAARKGMTPAVRLNGTTDYPWERWAVTYDGAEYPNLMAAFPDVIFYDYTKLALAHRTRKGTHPIPANYHLTFSISEREDADLRAIPYLDAGYSVAVVIGVPKGAIPKVWRGRPMVDGDKNDARFMDPRGCYVGLSAKGRAKSDTSGFVKSA